jgi:hypothetical protein
VHPNHGIRRIRELLVRLLGLPGEVEGLTREVRHLRSLVDSFRGPFPPLNGSWGQLVISRYRPVLKAESADLPHPVGVFEWIETDVGTIALPRFDRFILPELREHGCWEPEESALLRKVIEPGMTVIDVGANVGYSALVMSQAVGEDGLVMAFRLETLKVTRF